MDEPLTLVELNRRWENVLIATDDAVCRHPEVYRELKTLVGDIVLKPLDIGKYLPATSKLADFISTLDAIGEGSIFHFFRDCVAPSSIWHLKMLRVECQDLLAYLKVFDDWRIGRHRLRVVK